MGRRADRLITHIRTITENDTTNSTTDITDNEILQYINEGQHRIQSKILAQHPRVFIKEKTITAVQSQEEYSLPADCYLAGRVLSIEYTSEASSTNPIYHRLIPASERNRLSHLDGVPTHYIRQDKLNDSGGTFLASPRPSESDGQFRVRYVQKIDILDKRRGIVSAVTLNSSTSTITSLTLDTSGTPPIDSTELDEQDYICVVDSLGAIQMRNIRFTAVSSSTGVVTVGGSFTYESGETIAVGDYIVGGVNATTHSKLPDSIERYLIQFAAFKMFKRDSSTDSAEQTQELLALEDEIVNSYQEIDDDLADIEIVDNEWMDFY